MSLPWLVSAQRAFFSQRANTIPELCSWLVLGCIPLPWPNGWNILNGKVWIMCQWKLELRVGRTASLKVKSIWWRGGIETKRMDVGLTNMFFPWCWGRMSFLQAWVLCDSTSLQQMNWLRRTEEWPLLDYFVPCHGKLNAFNSTQLNSTYLNSI